MTAPPTNKGKRFPGEILTPEETKAMMEAIAATPSPPVIHLRNKATMAVLLGGGLRIAEALAVRPDNVDPVESSIHVLKGKGGKARIVAVSDDAMAHISAWIAVRRVVLPDVARTAPLLCTMDGTPMQPRYVRAVLTRAAKRAGITKRVHPHGMRRIHAVRLDRKLVPVTEIRDQLGHTSVATTEVYLRTYSPAMRLRRIRGLDMDMGDA